MGKQTAATSPPLSSRRESSTSPTLSTATAHQAPPSPTHTISPSPPTTPLALDSHHHHQQSQQQHLANSEPTLRFPRPQGNTRLASWISNSNPDIMRLTSTTTAPEESGLSESTYELISGTDSESQDGNYTESMGESVGSLEFQRGEDVQSLAGTEHTYDDESVVGDLDDHIAVTSGHNGGAVRSVSGSTVVGSVPQLHSTEQDESDEQEYSRTSLEYTQHHLGTPSLPTPEASNVLGKASANDESKEGQDGDGLLEWQTDVTQYCKDFVQNFWARMRRFDETALESVFIVTPVFFILLILSLPVVFYSWTNNATAPAPVTTVSMSTPMEVVTTSTSTAVLRPTTGAGLIPLDDKQSEEWLFGSKKPVVTFTPQGQGDILVKLPAEVKNTWLTKGCLTISASRNKEHVDTIMSPVDEGIMLKFPRREAYGVVNLALASTCRPKVQKVVKVHFGKGALEKAYDWSRTFVDEVKDLVVPFKSGDLKWKNLNQAGPWEKVVGEKCQDLARSMDQVMQSLQEKADETRKSLAKINYTLLGQQYKDAVQRKAVELESWTQQAMARVSTISRLQWSPLVQEARDQVQLSLLDAQISAKLWWLKVTGREEERTTYQHKAKDYIAKKQAASKEASKLRKFCQRMAYRGGKVPERCKHAM